MKDSVFAKQKYTYILEQLNTSIANTLRVFCFAVNNTKSYLN